MKKYELVLGDKKEWIGEWGMKFKTLEEVEIEHIRKVLEYYHFNKTHAAKVLGITDRGLRLKCVRYLELRPTDKELLDIELRRDKIMLYEDYKKALKRIKELENE